MIGCPLLKGRVLQTVNWQCLHFSSYHKIIIIWSKAPEQLLMQYCFDHCCFHGQEWTLQLNFIETNMGRKCEFKHIQFHDFWKNYLHRKIMWYELRWTFMQDCFVHCCFKFKNELWKWTHRAAVVLYFLFAIYCKTIIPHLRLSHTPSLPCYIIFEL